MIVAARRFLLLSVLLAAPACQQEQAPSGRGGIGDAVGRLGEGGGDNQAAPAPTPNPRPANAAPDPSGGASPTAAPDPGTPQRRAIMDAARPAIETVLRSPVEFVVERVAVQDGWALLIADPQKPGGGAIDGSHLGPEEERDGLTVNAILRFQNGRWNLVDHAIGPTDVWYCGYEGPPRSLLGC